MEVILANRACIGLLAIVDVPESFALNPRSLVIIKSEKHIPGLITTSPEIKEMVEGICMRLW